MIVKKKKSLFLLGILLLLSACGGKEQPTVKAELIRVAVQKVEMISRPETFSYSGNILADNSVSIGFGVSGRVTAVYVQEGQCVSKGQLLAAIETSTYQNALAVAGAGMDQAQDNFNRLNQLYLKKSLPERDYIAAKVALAQSKANRDIAMKNLRDTKLYASFSGIVSQKLTEAGAMAAPGVPAFTVVKTDKIYATAAITENEISALKIGTPAEVSIPSLNRTIHGNITIINPQADDNSKTYTVKIRLDNPGGQILPGMITDINIKTGKSKDAIILPAQAILKDPDGSSYVYTVKSAKNGATAFKKRVEMQNMAGASDVIIKSGLTPDEQVVISGQTRLGDGTPVKF
ncbi:MAG: efflux RND transporter periplasmic adaptor subunit [Candidatus Chryseobacterium colombiense]|nr:efflux RND transporter periplasmic adaptor subunit [Chryseobacterium sp.]WEK70403.1 MAG: efflux RND transporter periplasmic adaptor subunit [Chryseobacterium sp.]